tara:strand:- start:3158 stop:3634 length:477 start_codon:yes stop_codon:yes gene_type:complete
MEKLSPHITIAEAVHSNTAKRLSIDNTPSDEHLGNMLTVAEMIFEPLRKFVGGPIKINSFYRSPALNKAIGGATKNGKPTSQHCNGQAIDIDDVYGHASNAQMFDWIKANLDFDQMIWEFGTDINPSWVHVSYVDAQQNRKRCLKAYKKNGKTKYKVI